MADIELSDVTLSYDKIDCGGAAPVADGYKKGDLVLDISNDRLWQWNGSAWRPYLFSTGTMIDLPAGSSLAVRLASGSFTPPVGVTVYSGNDPSVPSTLTQDATVLAIQHNLGCPINDVAVLRLDVSNIWVKVPLSASLWVGQSADMNWSIISGLMTAVGNDRVKLILTGFAG